MLDIKYGLLTIDKSNQLDIPQSSNKKILFLCDCGSTKLITLKSVLNNLTKSCGCLLSNKSSNFIQHSLSYKGTPKAINVGISLLIEKLVKRNNQG